MKLVAKGNTAEIMEYEGGLICKLFAEGYPEDAVRHEFRNARTVFGLGIHAPAAHELVMIGSRDGILYDRVMGEDLLILLQRANPAERVNWMTRFCKFHKEILRYRTEALMDYRDFLRMLAENAPEMTEKIDRLPDGNHLLHGDYHPGNVMVDVNGALWLIDMMNVCRGPAEYDVARTYFLLGVDEAIQKSYLNFMNYGYDEIRPYLDVIIPLREKEMNQ